MSLDERQTEPAVNWPALVAVGVAILMTTADLMIVQTALPSMERTFGIGPDVGQWLILAYAGATIALQMPAGRWLDSVSPRHGYLLATGGFMVASVLCAIAPNAWFLIGARLVQGAFGALLGALVPAIIVSSAPPERRGRAMGIVGTLGPLGAVAGPVLGGILLAWWDWRGIFLVNVPVGLAAMFLGGRAISAKGNRITVPGIGFARETLAAVIAGGSLFTALTLASSTHPRYGLAAAALLVTVLAGAWWYREPGGNALLGLLGVWPMGVILLGSFGVNIIGGTLNYLPPFTLDEMIHLPVSQWGLVLLSMPLGLAIASNLGGFVTDWLGAARTTIIGACVILLGTALLAVAPAWGGAWGFAARLLLTGLGMGMYHVPAQTLFMTQAPAELRATAGAAVNLLRNLGFSVGPALATLLWYLTGSGPGDGLKASYGIPVTAALVTLTTTVWLVRRASQPVPVPAS
ncbi:MFS transporter [Streptomyces eurythermus]|uniref:MFS transporter n=1 Tax=Streptomyces eurythermus TaxID=42237 RepID=UPI0036B04F9A